MANMTFNDLLCKDVAIVTQEGQECATVKPARPLVGIIQFLRYLDKCLLFEIPHEEQIGIYVRIHADQTDADVFVGFEILFLQLYEF